MSESANPAAGRYPIAAVAMGLMLAGRRTILLAFAFMALGSLVFAFADGLIWLIVARIVQGVAMGIGTGAAAAAIREWMHEADRGRAGEVTVIAVATVPSCPHLHPAARSAVLTVPRAIRRPFLIALASLIAGAGGGLSYLAGLNIIGRISPPDHRAETLSAYLVAGYLGYSIPALGAGIAATRYGLNASFIGAAIVLGAIAISVSIFTTNRNLRVTPSAS